MSIDQMELLFQMLILQNSDRKVIDVFPSYNGKETTFGQCEIKRDVHGKRGEPLFIYSVRENHWVFSPVDESNLIIYNQSI